MKVNILPRKFDQQHIVQAQKINLNLNDYHHRLPVWGITIDDVTTVDRDDGIWLIPLDDDKYELQVSITDVSELVNKDSPIDLEANQRVVTLYHTQPPTPMLPHKISTNLGSLDEDKPTLAMTVFFIIDRHGKINSYEIKETIFTNKKAFSYQEVEKILQNPQNIPEHKILCNLQKISQLISKNRGGKSGILTEEGYIDEDGNLIKDNINAHQLIAELMILTNKTIADFLAQKDIQAIYRTQDVGTLNFKLAIKNMGHCLVPAQYEPISKSHVSLGLINYTHFTSPLRRFVDLVNHRILKQILQKKSSPYSLLELSDICTYINDYTNQLKLDKANYLKGRRKQELEYKYSNLERLKVANVSSEELSDLIKYCVNQSTIKTIIPQLKLRVKELQPKDFYYLWFVGKINDFWQEEIDTVSVLLVRSQLDDTVVSYTYKHIESQQIHLCHCYLDGLTTIEAVADSKKSKAKQKAALATIKGYIEDNLITKPLTIEPKTKTKTNLDQIKNKANIDDKEFSKIIDRYLKSDLNDDNVLKAIEQRIEKLPPKDLYKIWFTAKINQFFDYPNIDGISVVFIHSQLTNTQIDYQIDYLAQTKQYSAYCYIDGLTHPIPRLDTKKSQAKQKAALAYIQAYINQQLIKQPQPVAEIDSAVLDNTQLSINFTPKFAQPNVNNWVSQLNELSQLNPEDKLSYQFEEIDNLFVCTLTFIHHQKTLKSIGYGKNKKEAKQMASQICLIQHNLLPQ